MEKYFVEMILKKLYLIILKHKEKSKMDETKRNRLLHLILQNLR